MWKSGHSVLKAKMQETGALLAGEMSGHIFFKERWYGFDDGLYSGARLLEIISRSEQSVALIFSALPDSCNTPEIHLPFEEGRHFEFMQKLNEVADFSDADVSEIDGLRVSYADGWGLIRASNTQPVVVFRFESETEQGLKAVQDRIRQQVLKVDDTLEPGF
jgi:phosphomannomutase